MRKYLAFLMVLMIVLCAGCGIGNQSENQAGNHDLSDGIVIVLDAYDTEKEENYTIEYTLSEKIYEPSPFAVAQAYDEAVVAGVYGKKPVIRKMLWDSEGILTIDFIAANVQALGLGSGAEGALFQNLAQSIGDNCPLIHTIRFSMDDKSFETGHLYYEPDENVWVRAEG